LTYGIPKRSPYRPFLFQQQLKLIENGALRALLDRWNEDEPTCNDSRVDSLGFEKIIMAFMIVVLGVVCSISTFVVEFLSAQLMPSSKTKNEMNDLFTGNYRQRRKTDTRKSIDMRIASVSKRLEVMLKKHIANKKDDLAVKEELFFEMEMLLYQLQSTAWTKS